jgi:YD repeat-containing protein
MPGPTAIPGLSQVIIDYSYDPLQRLTAADYSTGDYYHYTYDKVGNRLSQTRRIDSVETTVTDAYDDANRLSHVGGTSYTFDANGNLLSDGVNSYGYDSANRLTSVNSNQSSVVSYGYNGLGDRLRQSVGNNTTNYTLDLNAGLTQVLNDGTNTYLYGNGRISQIAGGTAQYFLGDALGSVRQLSNQAGTISLAQNFDPYGVAIQSSGNASSIYGYDGEQTAFMPPKTEANTAAPVQL